MPGRVEQENLLEFLLGRGAPLRRVLRRRSA